MNEAWTQQPEVTELTPEELEQYLALQKKVGWRRTGTPAFESNFSIWPFTPSEQALVRERDGVKEVLMWRRKDAYYEGWHMAGGYIIRGESDDEWVNRVIKKETDLTLRRFFPIRRFNTRPETGWVPNHQMAVFFVCEVEGEPSVGKFFPIYPKPEIPDDVLGHHVKYLDCLRAHFMRMKAQREGNICWDYVEKASQWRWRVVLRDFELDGEYFKSCGDHGSLDTAVKVLADHRGSSQEPRNFFLVDDQGLQIL